MNGKIYTGTNLSIPFNQDGVIKDFEISGNSKQETRSGKNKLKITSFVDRTTDGVTFTAKFDIKGNLQYINAAGNSTTGYRDIIRVDISNLPVGNYILSGLNANSVVRFVLLKSGDASPKKLENSGELAFTQDASSPYTTFRIDLYQAGEIDCQMKPMIRLSSETDNTYEPYGASPSPDYPSEIESCGDNINLYNKDTETKGIMYNDSGNLISNNNWTTGDYEEVKSNSNIVMNAKMNSSVFTQFMITEFDNSKNFIKRQVWQATTSEPVFTYTLGSTTKYIRCGYRNDTGMTDIKVEYGLTKSPYSPYGQGCINEVICNKNFLKFKTINNSNNGLTYNFDNNTAKFNGTTTATVLLYNVIEDVLLKKGIYTFSFKCENTPSANSAQFILRDSSNKNVVILNSWGTNGKVTKTFTEDIMLSSKNSYFYSNGKFTYNNTKYILQIEKNSEVTDYIEHQSQTYTIPTQQPFRAIRDIRDTFIKKDGKWYERHYIFRKIFDGTESFGDTLSNNKRYYFMYNALNPLPKAISNNGITPEILSNKLTKVSVNNLISSNKQGIAYNIEGKVYIYTETTSTMNNAQFRTYLVEQYNAGTPVYVDYVLKEPLDIKCTEEQNEILKELSAFTPITHYSSLDEIPATLKINTNSFVPIETTQMQTTVETISNEQTRINLELWSHDDKFIDTLYSSDYEFDGQCIDPKMTLNANGSKTLTLSLPLYIIDKRTGDFIENPRWNYIIHQYKIRVKQDNRINEFVLKDYTESHDSNDQLMININAQSLEEFELSQTGYNITFNENSLYKYNSNDDPNDPNTIPIGTYEPDIHFWNKKLLENSDWDYRVESYYPIDRDMSIDNRQVTDPELDYKNGKEQFYEEDRIIDYTKDNEPIYSDEYEIKKRVVKADKSNIFNIVQSICEAFECWPTFEIQYENEKIVKKTIVYKNDVPQDAKFSINYQTNLNSIQRTVDSSQIVTKMFVTPIQNDNVDNGIISISTNPKNFMKENYLLDLSWYLGENRADTDIKNTRLINPKIGMHFVGTNFSEPLFVTTDTDNTKDTISTYMKNIRNRNTYIENISLQLSKDQEELINLKTEREYVQSQKDSAQETINTLIDEMSLIGNTALRKENKACYLYKQGDIVIIRFSEIGIKNIPSAETFNTPINIISLDGIPFYEEGKVPAGTTTWNNIKTLKLIPYKVDPIIGTILECQVTNATLGSSTDNDYASFKCSFDYDPYDYYKKLISYWKSKVAAAEARLDVLGKSREDGGNSGLIYNLEGKVAEEKRYLFQAQQQKAQVVKEFESKFNPYIREGYWENTDFGIYMNRSQSKTYIPTEHKKLKYGQTEESASQETDKYDWSKDYVCYQVPNILINNGQGGTAYLYNVIDIDEIEVMNDDPLNTNDGFRTYVKGTDYTIEYGYSSNTPGVTQNDRGIYLRFYEPEVNTNNDYIPQFSADTQIYIRVKARGTTQYIWSGYIKPEYYMNGSDRKRKWFCPIEQRITINDKDIILSSIIVKANTSKINYSTTNSLLIENTQYELKYGKDYYTSKEIEDGVTVSRVTFYQTTNVPLMDFQYANYIIEYNQDITAKYYYNDALDVMKESSIPQTTYSINVLDISEAENFLSNLKWYKPQVGVRVPIYDEELRFKGLVGFVNSVTFDLLNPQNTQLSITNFKDKFVDLFQKITASTIALQSKEYEYDRSTQIVTVEGGINKDILKDTFERPDSNFTVTPNSNIKWDYSGITSTSDKLNENGVYAQVRVTPNGIFTANSKDEFGNYIWTTAITPQGINANQLTIGKLDTRQIQIFNSSEPRFMWNENGLYAYGQNNGRTDFETYVLYNENGIKFRQLMKSNKKVILPNIVKSPTFANLGDWNLSSTDNNVFDSDNTGVIEEVEIVGASAIPVYQATVASNKQTSNITLKLNSTKKDLVRDHKYYFRIYIKVNNIPELTNIDINGGFIGFYKNIQYSQNNQYVRIDGFVTGVTNSNNFAVNVVLPNAFSNWSIYVKKPMILDVTDIFGETIPSLQWFNDLTDIVDKGSWETDLDVYGDALRLDWGGLTIGAQDNSLQLTSQNGLVIYHPVTTETNNEKRMRLQLGQWQEPAKDKYGNIITDGTEVVYEDLYGLRALDLNGKMIFKISQRGVEFDFTNNLEQTIKNYSQEAALEAISSTNTSNLLKNSCGYVYEEKKDATGKPNGLYHFYDWDPIENENYIFPINERFTQKKADGSEVAIVEGTVSKHAFQLGGDNATGAMPLISQTINVATTPGVVEPFTFRFLMKGISNTQTSTIKNGIHLTIYEAGNQEDIDVDIPYVGNGEWQSVKYTIYTEMPQITITIRNISTITVDSNNVPTNGVIYLSDLMFTSGQDTPAWTVSPGEVYNNYVTIGSEGVIVTSDKDAQGLTVRTVMDSHSFRVETINSDKELSTNILVTGDSTVLGPTHIRGLCDIGDISRLRFVENADLESSQRNPGVDVTLIRG